jgi:hypothetical protein
VYRAVDQRGHVIDVYVSRRRDIASARRFFTAAFTAVLSVHGVPTEVIADRAPALANVIEDLVQCWVAQHRPVREQPGRVRPWPAEGQAQAAAWVEDRAYGERGGPGARVRSEPASWPLRARCRHRPAAPAGHRIRRTHTRRLTSPVPQVPPRPAARASNATEPRGFSSLIRMKRWLVTWADPTTGACHDRGNHSSTARPSARASVRALRAP